MVLFAILIEITSQISSCTQRTLKWSSYTNYTHLRALIIDQTTFEAIHTHPPIHISAMIQFVNTFDDKWHTRIVCFFDYSELCEFHPNHVFFTSHAARHVFSFSRPLRPALVRALTHVNRKINTLIAVCVCVWNNESSPLKFTAPLLMPAAAINRVLQSARSDQRQRALTPKAERPDGVGAYNLS